MTDFTSFPGFPPETLQFLADLSENNHKDWFDANRQRYQDHILAPTQVFVGALGTRLKEISPDVQFDTRTNGQGSMMRIYRDVRFSKDKTPYKTNVAIAFWEGPHKKMKNPIFGLQYTYNGAGLMAGMHGFEKPMLEAYRKAVDNERSGAALEQAVAAVQVAGDYGVHGEHYKRVPRGYDPDHPRADLLRHNALYVYSPPITSEQLLSPDLIDICYEHCRNMAPIQKWLVQVAA